MRGRRIEKSLSTNERYDLVFNKITMPENFYQTALSLLPTNLSGAIILDVGCGRGGLIKRLKEISPDSSIVALDFSKESIKLVKSLGADCILADVLKMPFKSESVNIVFCTEVIEHVDSSNELLVEIRRILRLNGKLIISIPNRWAYYPAYALIRILPRAIRKTISKLNIHGHFLWHLLIPDDDPEISFQPVDHSYSSGEILKWLKNTGFSISKTIGFGYFKNLWIQETQLSVAIASHLPSIFAYSFFILTQRRD